LTAHTIQVYHDAPPIPAQVVSPAGDTIFTQADILAGQRLFLQYSLMENGSIWGHGAYLGPDFSAAYLHALAIDVGETLATELYNCRLDTLTMVQRDAVDAEVQRLLKRNRYDAQTNTLVLTPPEVASFRNQIAQWAAYFAESTTSASLPHAYITDLQELRQLTEFFAWTAWASVANRPGKTYSYTNNFPYEPLVGNRPTSEAVLWSALSLIALLADIALVLFAFGKFSFLGWQGERAHVHPHMLPGTTTANQQALIKYFVIVALLFFVQVLVGEATAHYRADPGSFYCPRYSRT
jgi:nitric oxide reductase subunit B